MDGGLTERQWERYKALLPSINYLINLHFMRIEENETVIDKNLHVLKEKMNLKFKNICKAPYDYLIAKKLLIENVEEDNKSLNDFSLFLFEFINLRTEEDRNKANEFVKCVTQISADANGLIERMNAKHEKIENDVKYCKSNCIFKKIKESNDKDSKENEIFSCLENCLKKVGADHDDYAKEYLDELDKINKFI